MTQKNQKTNQSNFWSKTRPLQIAVLVIAIAIGSIMLFTKGNGYVASDEGTQTPVSAENSQVMNLTDDIFEQTISTGVVLVDFWAVWCPPCRIQNPIIEDLASEIGNKAIIAKLDVDHNPGSASKHGIQNIPTLIIYKDGVAVQRFVGVQQKETLMNAIKSHI